VKYAKVFISILYLIIGAAISFLWPILEFRGKIITLNLYGIPQAIFFTTIIGFFIYFIRIKDKNLYWSILFLSLTINCSIFLIFNIASKIFDYYVWDKVKLPWFNEFLAYIIIWIIFTVVIIGLILLHFYFKSRYRKKLIYEKN